MSNTEIVQATYKFSQLFWYNCLGAYSCLVCYSCHYTYLLHWECRGKLVQNESLLKVGKVELTCRYLVKKLVLSYFLM